MANYKLCGPDESTGVIKIGLTETIQFYPIEVELWQEYEAWKAEGNTPDPQYTTEEESQIAYEGRQAVRIQTLVRATIDQFDMILALFQVGRDNGIWTATDFPADLRAKAVEWRQLIDDYRSDTP